MNTKSLSDRLYRELEKLTRDTPLTLTGWLLFILLISVPIMLGCAYVSHDFFTKTYELTLHTNGMEHTDNWHQLHKGDKYE